jgi:PAS domain S-box-containing protein
MDRLNNEERIEAWLTTWDQSMTGKAIVERDGTFRSVNPQFWRLLNVTPSDLIGKRFQDITPPGIRELDEDNAELLADGLIPFYIMPKTYQFAGGHQVDIILEVNRVPVDSEQPFQFFAVNILLDEDGRFKRDHEKKLKSEQSFQKQTTEGFLNKYGKWLAALGALIAGAVSTLG